MLDRERLLEAFGALGRLAWAQGKTIEIAVYGGSALMLSYDWRLATKDVDAVYEDDRTTVRTLAAAVAAGRPIGSMPASGFPERTGRGCRHEDPVRRVPVAG